jgi:membrane protease YdiL (CAAX protease family)
MSIDPEIDAQPELQPQLPEAAFPSLISAREPDGLQRARRLNIPNLGHALVFLAVFGGALMLVQTLALGLALGLHWFPHETYMQVLKEPRLLVPASFFSYIVGGLVVVAIFSKWWHRPFAEGVHWNLEQARRYRWWLIGTGIVVSIVVQVLSNFLPIPKELPIDEFFHKQLDVWIVAIFGIFVAPVFEELAFRGFLLPALATSWDWLVRRFSKGVAVEQQNTTTILMDEYAPMTDPAWSAGAIAFASTLTSIVFALLHADQLAHAYAPLGVLFCVSLVLCGVRLRFHSLAASALVHACYNGTIFALLFFATSGFRHLEKLNQ